jgi:hypothetical protein
MLKESPEAEKGADFIRASYYLYAPFLGDKGSPFFRLISALSIRDVLMLPP